MTPLFRTQRLLLFAVAALILPLAVACSGGDNEQDPTSTTGGTSSVATSSDTASSTSDTDPTPDADTTGTPDADGDTTGTPDADTTGTPDADETPSAGTTGTPEADTTGTPDADETPDGVVTGTPGSDSTPGSGAAADNPFVDLGELQAQVENFTLEMTGSFENVPDETGATFSSNIEMFLQQSEPDVYQLRFVTEGDEEIALEMWALPDATYISESGADPVELPGGLTSEFSPAEFLMIVPPVETLEDVEEVGPDEVNGRPATLYRVDAEQAAGLLVAQGVEIEDPQGEMEIWIDDGLGVMVQMISDITFTNTDGTEGSASLEYRVTDIDETMPVEAPA